MPLNAPSFWGEHPFPYKGISIMAAERSNNQVEFSYEEWRATYPNFTDDISQSQVENFFNLACLILNNTASSLVQDLTTRKTLLGLLVAHQAQLFTSNNSNGQQNNAPPVGRLASASRGSVSLTMDGSALPRHAGWFTQTQYGLTFWQATAPYRQMRFIPGRPHAARLWP